MGSDKETIVKRYQQLSDVDFSAINADELTDEGRAAYYEEKIRRSSSDYKEKKAYEEKKEAEKAELEAAEKIKPYVTAGRLFRFLGWISAVAGIGITAAIFIPHLHDPNVSSLFSAFVPWLLLILVLIILQFKVGSAIKEHKEWGRTVGILLAIIHLFGFPIGTLIGAYILWCLTKGWGDKIEGQIQPIIPIDTVIGFELIFVAPTFLDTESDALKQSWKPILCKAWPKLFPLILDRKPKLRFKVAFVSSPEEANAHIKSTHDELGANLVVQSLTIQIAVPPQSMRDYGITLALYLSGDTGKEPVVIVVAPNHTLAPDDWIT